jgi:hypothetical protein
MRINEQIHNEDQLLSNVCVSFVSKMCEELY